MVKVLKLRITLILSIFVSLLLIAVLVFVNVFSYMQASNDIYNKLEASIATVQMGGRTIKDMAAIFFEGDNATIIFNEEEVELTNEELYRYAYRVAYAKKPKKEGFFEDRFYAQKKMSKGILVLVTNGEEVVEQSKTLEKSTIIFGAVGALFSIAISTLIANLLVKPVQETIDNERAFISDASHELKTPLAVIGSNADALETEIGENKWLSCIKSETMRTSTLINEMLTVSRIEKNNDRYSFKKVDLSSCTEEAVMNFEAPAFEKGVLIESDIQPGVSVHGSPDKLKQVVEILLDNAVKYVEENGKIKVTLKPKLTGAVLTVENTGSYIEKQDLKKVFERFYRTDSSRAKQNDQGKTRSYGLGLAIAKRIVEAHDGNITAASFKNVDSSGNEILSTQFKVSL